MTPYAITITRQFGSEGREIGKQLAERLHCHYYDRSVIEQEAAQKDESLAALVALKQVEGYYKMAYPLGIGSSRNQERVLRCYLYAPDAYRASSVASLNLSTASEYQPLIDEVDKARASYYLKYTGYPVDNLELRDLVVNTACLGLEGTVEMLAAFAAKKFGLNLKEQA